MDTEITISIENYNKLIQESQKAKQYKNYFLDNTHNNQLNKVVCTIEGKSLYQLIEEKEGGKQNENSR